MRHISFIILSFFMLFSIGCGSGGLTGLAEGILYPFESVDKKYPVPENPPEGLEQTYTEIVGHDGTPITVHAWIHDTGSNRNPTLVFFHGNGTNLQVLQISGFLDVLRQLKFNFVVMDYPGLGRSTGTPNQPNLWNAGKKMVEYAHNRFRRSRLIIWGRSLGAAVASQVGYTEQPYADGLILTSPWFSFLTLALEKTGLAKNLPEEWLALHGWNSAEAVKDIKLKTMIHHGNKDTLIPFKFGQMLFEAFTQTTPNFIELDGVGHNDVFSSQQFWNDIKGF